MDEAEVNRKNLYVREVTARYVGPRRRSFKLTGPETAARFMRKLVKDQAREHFIALYLGTSHRVISHSLVSLGLVNSAPVHPREVYRGAILVGACAVLVGHNHPSGDLVPSEEDIKVTKSLHAAGDVVGIRLLDHIIFTHRFHISLRGKGQMP